MSDYQVGKDMQKFEDELRRTQMLLEQVYAVLDYNIKEGQLKEVKEKKGKE